MEEGIIDIKEIKKMLPHRAPFLLIDRILYIKDNKEAVGIKNVTVNEPFFAGHFPGQPIMPGVLIVEAMAQVCGAVFSRLVPPDKLAVFLSIDNVKFRKMVVPGDQLRLEAKLLRFGGKIAFFEGRALVDNEIVAEGRMAFALTELDRFTNENS